ncbi:pre-piRNA 3'-exonuclease trimmer [Xylocopa sonorina]|uniref:pre-piRNA 3'-exonuclease trimmer n=1 Tax=Xylocopa sonorina TaxID=1818115 RepID=UPI00403B2533
MIEVSEKNFQSLYPELESVINNASFIAIDAEFTGIHSEENLKPSLFDTLENRYKLLRKNIQQFVIVQFGIAAFHHVPSKNTYEAKCYNFYLFPRPVPFRNRQFTCQVSALEFLHTHKFDFNKLVDEGICYLDEADEKLLTHHLEQGNLLNNFDHLSYEEEDVFKDCKNKISEWLKKDNNMVSIQVETPSTVLQYMVHKGLRNNFKNIWTTSGHKTVDVIRVTPDMHELLEKEDNNRLEKALLDSYLGFSKIFKLLSSSKKPIIGHNNLLDLMFIHQQFYKPLPESYKEFKSNVHSLFPQIYDTKFVSFELRKVLSKDEATWKLNSLSTLYEYFTSEQSCLTFNSPRIDLSEYSLDIKSYHNAGWDAYFAGYIFIKMGHIFCVSKFGMGLEERSVTHSELMNSVKDCVNCVNITRGNEVYMRFDGPDPTLSRPEWLHVKLKSSSIDPKQLVEKFSTFGHVDVMPFTRRHVLVAVANHKSAQYILQHFKCSQEFQVARYSRLRHAAPITICLWSGVVLSGGMLAWMINRMLVKSS